MTNDLLLLMPLIIVGAGAILLMLSSAYEKISHEMAAYGSALVFAIAFLVQLGSCITGKAVLFSDIFNSFLVVTNFSKAAGLIILACGLFTVMSAQTYFKQNTFCSPEFYSLTVFAASGMLLLTMAQELISVFIALEIMSLGHLYPGWLQPKNVISTELF
jgi:NADH:ubiquinone oxidoreductase subunit 2 (chain N)